MMKQKLWVYKDINEKEVDRLAKDAGISKLLAKVFVSRGISDIEYVRSFLDPDVSRLYDPFLMDGMDTAVGRIWRAVDKRERILIYGDYDVDGVMSTSALYNFLSSRGADVGYFIPDRMDDGYGLTMASAAKVKLLEPSLMVTVDCGITSADEVLFLMKSGIDVVVTDHHECKEILPEAVAVLNPHKPECHYPFKDLAGAGVAFKLLQGMCIREESRRPGSSNEFLKYIDLVGLATIADIVPLQDENRIIASLGLKAMESSQNKGMAALVKAAGYGGKEITSYGAAFGLAPRVNAAGRLGSAERSVRLFTTDDRVLAEALAKELDAENRQRQDTENIILEQAVSYVESKLDPKREKVLVICGQGWHHGVIGIVSSKITERYNRPSIVISIDEDGTGKGSGRSIKGFNLFRALSCCEDMMDRFGGHEMAAGLTIQSSRIEELRASINEYADSALTDADMIPCQRVDAFLERRDITLDSVRELAQMAPFGESNPPARFGYMALLIAEIRTLSNGRHLKLKVQDGSFVIEAIGFNMGEMAKQYSKGDTVDMVFTPGINVWKGTEGLQLNIKDIKPCVFTNLDKNIVFSISNDYNNSIMQYINSLKGQYRLKPAVLVPGRSELETIYRYVRSRWKAASGGTVGVGLTIDDLYGLSAQLSEKYGIDLNFFKLKKALEIFEELGLLKLENVTGKTVAVKLTASIEKVDLESSKLYMGLQAVGKSV